MSCITNCFITEGYNGNDCFDNTGGVVEFYIGNRCDFESSGLTYSNATQSLATGYTASVSHDFYRFTGAEETFSWTNAPTVNKQNQTIYFTESVTLKINDWDASVRDKFLLLSKTPVVVIAKNNKGNYALLGRDKGLTLETAEFTSGVAFEDGFNLTLTLSNKSKEPSIEVAASVIGTDINPVFV